MTEPSEPIVINVPAVLDPASQNLVDRETFEARFASLEASNVALASDVRALTATLKIVNELQTEQRAQGRKVEETQKLVSATKAETDQRLARNRRSANAAAVATAILLPLASIIVYLVLLDHVNDLLRENDAERRTACQNRNMGTQADVDRERLLARIATTKQEAKIHSDSADQIAKSKINCDKIYGPK